jgi:hypothetical protein
MLFKLKLFGLKPMPTWTALTPAWPSMAPEILTAPALTKKTALEPEQHLFEARAGSSSNTLIKTLRNLQKTDKRPFFGTNTGLPFLRTQLQAIKKKYSGVVSSWNPSSVCVYKNKLTVFLQHTKHI